MDPWVASSRRSKTGMLELTSPTVGWWIGGPKVGSIVVPGGSLGLLDILGRTTRLEAPSDVGGLIVDRLHPHGARVPTGHGARLLVVDPQIQSGAQSGAPERPSPRDSGPSTEAGLVFRAPMGGRIYRRPSPDQPPFVQTGDVVEFGQTVCLLEVMKTFNRVVYGGAGLPERARVLRILVEDGADITGQDPLLLLEMG